VKDHLLFTPNRVYLKDTGFHLNGGEPEVWVRHADLLPSLETLDPREPINDEIESEAAAFAMGLLKRATDTSL